MTHKNKFNKLLDFSHTTKKERIRHTIAELKQMVRIIGEMAKGIQEYTGKVTESIEDMALSIDQHIKELQQEIDRNNNAKAKRK